MSCAFVVRPPRPRPPPAPHLDDDDAGPPRDLRRSPAESAGEVHDRHHRAAKIDDAANALRHHRYHRQLAILDDLLRRESRMANISPREKVRYCWCSAAASLSVLTSAPCPSPRSGRIRVRRRSARPGWRPAAPRLLDVRDPRFSLLLPCAPRLPGVPDEYRQCGRRT